MLRMITYIKASELFPAVIFFYLARSIGVTLSHVKDALELTEQNLCLLSGSLYLDRRKVKS